METYVGLFAARHDARLDAPVGVAKTTGGMMNKRRDRIWWHHLAPPEVNPGVDGILTALEGLAQGPV
jgi:hypothetical protein